MQAPLFDSFPLSLDKTQLEQIVDKETAEKLFNMQKTKKFNECVSEFFNISAPATVGECFQLLEYYHDWLMYELSDVFPKDERAMYN